MTLITSSRCPGSKDEQMSGMGACHMFGWELATAPPRNVRIAGFAAWGRGGKPKAGRSGGEGPKAKPFFCDNSANKNVIDWISGQLSARACFVSRLYVSLLLRPSTPPVSSQPRCRIRVPHRSMALYPCPTPIHVVAMKPFRGFKTENRLVLQLFCD